MSETVKTNKTSAGIKATSRKKTEKPVVEIITSTT